ncbi:MAG: transglutaminase-like domain-containing protein [Solobacterium sp.]|nr:transglutaminase-like domain-containing protein [Solobacterium sp.]
MLDIMKYQGILLPAEIETAKMSGDLDKAQELINRWMKDDKVPEAMKKRLQIEQEILGRIPDEYPFSEEEALEMIRQEIPDFTMEELREWEDCGAAGWIVRNGTKYLQSRFYASMKKVYPEIRERAGGEPSDSSLLDRNIADMKKNGRASWHVQLKASLKIRDEAFKKGKVRVHLPVPAACANMKNIRILAMSHDGAYIADESSVSRTVYFEKDLTENETFWVEFSYDSCVEYNDPRPEDVTGVTDEYTSEQEPQIVFTPLIKALCRELSGDETNPLVLARRFYDFVTKHVVYSFMPEYLTLGVIPDYCASRLKGDCGVQALLFITLCRCAGIPAKWQSGRFVTPDTVGNHDWAMFKVEPFGWMFADCSFGGSAYRAGCYERHDYYFGNLDPFRLASCNELLAEFDPPKKHWRIDPFDNQRGEAEFEDRGLTRQELEMDCKVIRMEKYE